MALNFPKDPELNETYPAGDVIYVWDGAKWTSKGSGSGIPVLPDADGNVIITGNLTVQGATITGNSIQGSDANITGTIQGGSATITGNVSAANASLSGDLGATNAVFSGDITVAGDVIDN